MSKSRKLEVVFKWLFFWLVESAADGQKLVFTLRAHRTGPLTARSAVLGVAPHDYSLWTVLLRGLEP